MSDTPHDAPRVIVFPPVIPIGAVALAAVLQWVHPLHFFSAVPPLLSAFPGAVLLVIGVGLMGSGRLALTRGGTNVHPARPALALVERGVYRWTRNPLYLGGSFAMFGCAFLFRLDWLPMLFVIALALLHFGIIIPEEVYLERKFGETYLRYKSRTPRYFGPF